MNGSDDEQHDAHVKCNRLAVAVAYGDAVARAARGVGALGAARRRPRGREGNEGGAYAHGAKVTGPRRTRRRGGAPVAETDDEHYCEHVKHFRRARVEAAYRASVDLLITAWKENPEFGIAIDMATVLGRTEPLKEYLASDKPLSLANRLWLIAFIERLEQRIASQNKKVGRPQRKSDAWNAATAERNAALLVASDQAAWRKENGRERVPPAETDGMINRAIAEAAKAFAVPAASIKKDNIRIALKAGRI
jgi:hypothetical protein